MTTAHWVVLGLVGVGVYVALLLWLIERAPMLCPLCSHLTRTWPVCEHCGRDVHAAATAQALARFPEWAEPAGLAPSQPELAWFVVEMERALRQNDAFSQEIVMNLARQARASMADLCDALIETANTDDDRPVVEAAASVAVLALVIADRWRALTGNVTSEARL